MLPYPGSTVVSSVPCGWAFGRGDRLFISHFLGTFFSLPIPLYCTGFTALLTIVVWFFPIYPDSIDLQDREAPSAQDHPRPTKPTSNGSLAPHQAETLREVAAETAVENSRSPRVSWASGDVGDLQQYAEDLGAGVTSALNSQRSAESDPTNGNMSATQQQDALAIAQNGGLSGQEADDADIDGDADDGMDDDMMDKISSSPSIEDGGSLRAPLTSPSQSADNTGGALSTPFDTAAPPAVSDTRSPFPYLSHPEHAPTSSSHTQMSRRPLGLRGCHHHLLEHGEFTNLDPTVGTDNRSPTRGLRRTTSGVFTGIRTEDSMAVLQGSEDEMDEKLDEGLDSGNESIDDCRRTAIYDISDEDDATDKYGLSIPYEGSDEDDDGDFCSLDDTKFLDSGWGGDCLQDAEDIDFEFVYALHTFVATVEGQANATKGDTMVLLDDSNSYWWLVRVVKDSSIGLSCRRFKRLLEPFR